MHIEYRPCQAACRAQGLIRILLYAVIHTLEHLEMLILEAHPFLFDPPPPWGKLKMHKVRLLTGNITYRAKHISP